MTGETDERDPSQLALPYVESGLKIGDYRARDVAYGTPGFLALGGAIGSLTVGLNEPVLPLTAIGLPLSVIGPAFAMNAGETTTGLDKMRAPIRNFRQKRQHPIPQEDAADDLVHGVREIRRDGAAIMNDGRMVGLLRLESRNSDTETQSELQTVLSALSTRIDETLEHGFRYYSTTTEFDPSEVVGKYRDAAFSERLAGDDWAEARELLHDVSDWYEGREAPRWDAKQWRHYVVVSVGSEDVDTTGLDMSASVLDGIKEVFGSGSDAGVDEEEWYSRMSAALESRLERVSTVFGAVPGVEVERVGPAENALLHSRYWSGIEHNFENVKDIRQGRLEEILSAPSYDVTDEYVRVGEQYCKTFWVSEWPVSPDPGFLRGLTTMNGVDVDITLRARARDKEDTEYELKHEIANIDADIEELEENTDIESIVVGDDMESYVQAYKVLHNTSVRPWDLNGYITVRAGTREALERAETTIANGVGSDDIDLDIEKRRALEDSCEDVRDVAESTPASLTLLSPDTRQRDLYVSGSPTAPDKYDEVSHRDRYTMVLGGTIGAAFPGLAAEIRHEDGVEWGRKLQDGSEVSANPFGVGGPGHALFIGDSGSGKTFSTLQKIIRWYLADDDRTVVLCDTFGDFEGITELLNGTHVVLGGKDSINPLHLSKTPERLRDSGVDAFGMKIDGVNAFISGVLREQGVDAGEYTTLIKESAYETYRKAGIKPDDYSTHGLESPTMSDYIDTLREIANNPEGPALSESSMEVDEIESNAATLLRKLSGFQDGREYAELAGKGSAEITAGSVNYLDLQQMENEGAVGKSVMLQLMLDRVYEAVQNAPGETLFLIDEAHYLLHSEETVEWLQRAARHWRHYNAGVWYASQSPSEFVSGPDDEDGHKDTIRKQATTIQFTQTDIEKETADLFDLNDQQYEFIRKRATRGDSGQGFSEALIDFNSVEGWLRTRIRASDFETALLTYDPDDPIDLEEHIRAEYGEVTA
ncbi:VirB4 family type IV secretion system protein [Haloterrigena salifodinae]|uniref:VirB4 family type IV secretion system protein n=1 Tax=Haloterrigena salifodinae TaxID=2675099 RepID=UPI000F898856|nr:hypothetical protein [Haloterrigena salifodinae]